MSEILSGAHTVMRALLDNDCTTFFVYPGGAILPLFDVLDHYGEQINTILMRHEQCIAHAATGYARVAKKPAVCVVTSGPGVSNLVSGIADAMMDGTPLIVISGQVKSLIVGTGAFQEVNVVDLMSPICKSVRYIDCVKSITPAIFEACELAVQGRPGPVVIDISVDTLLQEVPYQVPAMGQPKAPCCLDHDALIEIARALNHANRPLIIAGQGVLQSRAESALIALAKKTGIPLVTTLMAQELNYQGHHEVKGLLGMQGNYAPTTLSNEADVVLVLGSRLTDRIHCGVSDYLSQAQVIHVDIDERVFDRWIKSQWQVHSDVLLFLQQIAPYLDAQEREQWQQQFLPLYEQEEERVIKPASDNARGAISIVEVMLSLSRQVSEEVILVTDVGEHQMIAAKYFRSDYPAQFVTSGGYGVMGFGLPAAIGAKIADPSKMVVLIVGDGGFQMTLQELEVLKQESLNIKIIIMDNNRLGMISFWQDQFYARHHAFCKISGPEYDRVAEAYGLDSQFIQCREALDSGMATLLSSSKAFVLHVHTDPKEGCFPIVPLGAKRVDMVFS